jgi:hypothetical protein
MLRGVSVEPLRRDKKESVKESVPEEMTSSM